MQLKIRFLGLVSLLLISVPQASAIERHIMAPRVPADKIQEARALKSPVPESTQAVAKGKEIYEGKGSCFNCHGSTGRGDGPGGLSLDPSPRNFWHHGMWRHRSEGEIFWVIKYGSSGTGMIPFGGLLSDEEIWTVIQYERSFGKGHGPMGSRGQGGGRGKKGIKGPMKHRGGGHHEECCPKSQSFP